MRDSSPPETIRASGRSSSPGFGDTKNSAASIPRALQAASGDGAIAEPHLEPRLLHRQLGEQPLRAVGRTSRPRGAASLESACAAVEIGRARPPRAALELGEPLVAALEIGQLARAGRRGAR